MAQNDPRGVDVVKPPGSVLDPSGERVLAEHDRSDRRTLDAVGAEAAEPLSV